MKADTYTIVKGYKVYKGDAAGKPIAEFNEQQLHDWLCSGGYSHQEANQIITKVDVKRSHQVRRA